MKHSLIRFDGVLSENNTFEPLPGWETDRVAHRPDTGDGPYVLDLLDGKGEVILSVHPEVDFEKGCVLKGGESRAARVTAYVPHHPEARQLAFRYRERTLSLRPVASEPPVVKIGRVTRAKGKGEKYTVTWKAEHPEGLPLSFTVVYHTRAGRAFVVARNVRRRDKVTGDVTDLPGGTGCRFAVLATDGVRSAFDVSRAVTTEPVTPAVFILGPEDGAKLPYGQPVSLTGRAFESGAALSETDLVWKVDGKEVGAGSTATVEGLAPGQHKATLQHAPKGEVLAEASSPFEIVRPGKAQGPLSEQIRRIHDAVEVEARHGPAEEIHGMNAPVNGSAASDCGCRKCRKCKE